MRSEKEMKDLSLIVFSERIMQSLNKDMSGWIQILGIPASFVGIELETIGDVVESPELAHVVVRVHFTMEGAPISKVGIVSVRRRGSTWRLLLPEELKSLSIFRDKVLQERIKR